MNIVTNIPYIPHLNIVTGDKLVKDFIRKRYTSVADAYVLKRHGVVSRFSHIENINNDCIDKDDFNLEITYHYVKDSVNYDIAKMTLSELLRYTGHLESFIKEELDDLKTLIRIVDKEELK